MLSKRSSTAILTTALMTMALAAGCRQGPKGPDKPAFDAGAAAAAALAEYDANKDGKLDAAELKKCPALEHALPRADADGDKALSAGEIAARINKWFASGSRMMSGAAHITLDGRDLEGATVTFEPEKFLGEGFKPASGTTDAAGRVNVQGANEKFPGLYLGLYRVKVSKLVGGKETVPARYNSATTLGCEVADDIGGIGELEFHLRSR